jgi:hypothetical protein
MLRLSQYITSTPPILFIGDIILLYSLFYAGSSNIRTFTTTNKKAIIEDLKIDPTASITVITLIIAAVTILASVSGEHYRTDQGAILRGYQWLAGAALSAIAQLLLTRNIYGLTAYLTLAATDSLWWCLAWALWALFQALIPNAGWVLLLGIGPLGVLIVSMVNLVTMLGPD